MSAPDYTTMDVSAFISAVGDDTENAGGYFIACIVCGCGTDLTFSCGDDARPLVVEKWNRRV